MMAVDREGGGGEVRGRGRGKAAVSSKVVVSVDMT
jgi:hypothetical protein